MKWIQWKNALQPLLKYVRRNTSSTTPAQDTSISSIRLPIQIPDDQMADVQRIKQLVLLHPAISPAHTVEVREINNDERKVEVNAMGITKNVSGLQEKIEQSFRKKP